MAIFYLSDGKLCRYGEDGHRELPNGILDRTAERIRTSARREEWKTTGSGARFMNGEGGAASAEDRVASLQATVGGLAFFGDRLAYSLTIDEVSGIYTKRHPDDTEEGILYSDSTRAFGDLAVAEDGLLVSVGYAGQSHIALLHEETRELTILTEGRTVDTSPAVDPADRRSFYFSSAGLSDTVQEDEEEIPRSLPELLLAMHKKRPEDVVGPAAILHMDAGRTTLSEVLADPHYDYLRPSVGKDGTLYYLRRPYREEKQGVSLLGCLTDILLFPWNLLRALFGFFNFFSMKYGGKPLSHGGSAARHRSEREVFLEGNRIEAEKELRRNRRDEFPGIVPASYELWCRRPDGECRKLASGVYAYALREEDILLSNGSAILRLLPSGKREKLTDARHVTRIATFPASENP